MECRRLFGCFAFLLAAVLSFTDITTDIMLAREYHLKKRVVPSFFQYVLFLCTTSSIVLGGVVQTIIVIRNYCKRDSFFSAIPKQLGFLILITAPMLMAPVVTNLFGAYVMISNKINCNGIDNDDLCK